METKTPTTPDSLTKLSAEAIAFYVLTDVYPDNILDIVKIPHNSVKIKLKNTWTWMKIL